MAIVETIEKRELVVVLGEHEAPASWHWNAVRFLRNEDGTDAAPPQAVQIAASADDAAAHVGKAMTDQVASIAAQNDAIAALTNEKAALVEQLAAANAALSRANALLEAVRGLNSQYDANLAAAEVTHAEPASA